MKTLFDQTYYKRFIKQASKSSLELDKKTLEQIKKDFALLLLDSMSPVGIYMLDFKHGNYPYMSKSIEAVLGYKAEEFYKHGMNFVMSKIHPDDVSFLGNEMMKVLVQRSGMLRVDMLNQYRFSFNYRIKRADGKYIHILQQVSVALVDEDRLPMLCVGAVSDISFLKKDNSMALQLSKYDPVKNSFKDSTVLLNSANCNNPLSLRETQILKALADELSNEEIAKTYDISVNTVRAHRRNILTHAKCKNTNAVIALALREGWI